MTVKSFLGRQKLRFYTLKSKKSLLVSCGGGIVEKDVNLALMREMESLCFDGDLSDSFHNSARIGRPDLGSFENATRSSRLRPRYEAAADITIGYS